MTTLETRIGYRFKNKQLLAQALTHASAGEDADYERLEFLGDRVVNLIVAENLFALYPADTEGDLSKRHTALVRGETLARAARMLALGEFMALSDSERQTGGAENEHILADILEAVIGAVFIDGGLDAAQRVLEPLIEPDVRNMTAPPSDPKTTLQEWSQARSLGLPEYEVINRSGPDHAPDFEIAVRVHGYEPMSARGTSKRMAEKAAAQKMLEFLGVLS